MDKMLNAGTGDARFQIVDGTLVWTEGDVSLIVSVSSDLWSYWVVRGDIPITMKITSKRAPWEEDSHSRDPKLRKWLNKHPNIDTSAVMDSFCDFGIFLMSNPDVVAEYVGSATPTPVESQDADMSESDKNAAMALLQDPKMIEIIDDAIHRKLIGETKNGFLTFFVILSARADHPLNHRWNGDSSTGKTAIVVSVVYLFPREMIIMRAGMTAKVFYYSFSDEDEHGNRINDLRGKAVIVLEEEESQDFLREIKPILSHDMDEIKYSFVDKVNNRNKTCTATIRGHPSYIGLTTQVQTDDQINTRASTGTPDYDPQKFESILDATAQDAVLPKQDDGNGDALIIGNAIRLLRDVRVLVPYMMVVRRHFPYTAQRAVRDFKQFISVIKTVAYLHQYQREHVEITGNEYIIANLSDLDIATRITESVICETVSGVPKDVLDFYGACVAGQCDPYNRKMLLGVYRKYFGKEIGRTRLTERYINPLVDRGLLERDETEKEHKFYVVEKNLSLSVDLDKMIADIQSEQTKARMKENYMCRSDTEKEVCMCVSGEIVDTLIHSALAVSQRHISEKVLAKCFEAEYPRDTSLSAVADNDRLSDEKEPEDDDVEDSQSDRMKKIDIFFREHRNGDGERAEIGYASRKQLDDYVPVIAEMLRVSKDVARQSVREYGRSRTWI
jgi:hypothetical protein